MNTVRYYFLQFMPDYSSREVLNWGMLFLIETPPSNLNVLAIYDRNGRRLRAAIPWYTQTQHDAAIKALTQFIENIQKTPVHQRSLIPMLKQMLPLGHRVVKGGVDANIRDWQSYLDDMYAYYITRQRCEQRNADAPQEF